MSSFELIDISNRERWRTAAIAAGATDIYFTPEYAEPWNNTGRAKSLLFSWQGKGASLVYPFRLRPIDEISGLGKFSGWYDVTSEYGYGGPVVSAPTASQRTEAVSAALDVLYSNFQNLGVVTEFCRYHPLFANHKLMPPERAPEVVGSTAVVDLSVTAEVYWRSLRENHRRDILRCQKNEVRVRNVKAVKEVDLFHDLYTQTMTALGASEFYLFSKDFFRHHFELLDENARMFVAEKDGVALSAVIIMIGDRFAHYHLGASNQVLRKFASQKLLFFEAISWARDRRLDALHLGGGVGNTADSLMAFKAGFTDLRAEYAVNKVVHNPKIYAEICAAMAVPTESRGFFPPYRSYGSNH